MTKNKALFAWFNEFMPFYRASSVLEDVVMPYGTYEYPDGAFDAGEIGLTVNLWFRTESEAIPDEKAQELSQRIGYGGVYILCDEGYIWNAGRRGVRALCTRTTRLLSAVISTSPLNT